MENMIFFLLVLLLPIVNQTNVSSPHSGSDLFTLANLTECGLTRDVFEMALKGLSKLDTAGKLQNRDIVSIADYSQSSNKKRFYVIDLKNRKLLFNTYVAHGRNTGDEFASSFSNVVGSYKSSLGFYVTENSIIGSHTGFSLMIDGVEKGFNDNAVKREIIIHAADYATESFIKKYGRLGRSFGCPVLPPDVNKQIIETIEGGSCLFIYNPNEDYICNSTLLN
jgi:hypothetical protein